MARNGRKHFTSQTFIFPRLPPLYHVPRNVFLLLESSSLTPPSLPPLLSTHFHLTHSPPLHALYTLSLPLSPTVFVDTDVSPIIQSFNVCIYLILQRTELEITFDYADIPRV